MLIFEMLVYFLLAQNITIVSEVKMKRNDKERQIVSAVSV